MNLQPWTLAGARLARWPAAALLAAWMAPSGAATLDERLASLAANPDETLRYEEQRESGLLSRTVTVRGRLEWDPETGHLTKWVDEPRQARLTITADGLEAETGNGRTRSLPLDQRPELAALFDGLRALLGGDPDALEDRFQADYLEGEGSAWVMHLVPRDASLAQRLALLEIRGTGDRVEAIDTVLENGERQRMRILSPEPPETQDPPADSGDGGEVPDAP